MKTGSLFDQLFWYRERQGSAPYETMLSDLLATLLNRLPKEVVQHFVADLFLPAAALQIWMAISDGASTLRWNTEVFLEGGRADIVLFDGVRPLVLVENKIFSAIRIHASRSEIPSGQDETHPISGADDTVEGEIQAVKNQLHTYGEWLKFQLSSPGGHDWPGALVLLTHSCPPPDDFGAPIPGPYGVPWQHTCRWHEVWRWLDKHAGPALSSDPVAGDTRPGWKVLARETADFLDARQMSSEYLGRPDLLFVEGYLDGYSRISDTLEMVQKRVGERAAVRMNRLAWTVDPELGALWAYGYLPLPHSPRLRAYFAWGVRFPGHGAEWEKAHPALPSWPQAVVVLGKDGNEKFPSWNQALTESVPRGWSVIEGGEWLRTAAGRPLAEFPPEPEHFFGALVDWAVERIAEIEPVLNVITGTATA